MTPHFDLPSGDPPANPTIPIASLMRGLPITNHSEQFEGPVYLLAGTVVPEDRLPALIAEAIEGPSRRVRVHGGDKTWEERSVSIGGGIWSAMAQKQ